MSRVRRYRRSDGTAVRDHVRSGGPTQPVSAAAEAVARGEAADEPPNADTVRLWREGLWFVAVAELADLGAEVASQGRTRASARKNLAEAVALRRSDDRVDGRVGAAA